MSIAIKGIRIKTMSLENKDGLLKLIGTYELLSSVDTVLAQQQFGPESYHGMLYNPSPAAANAINSARAAIQADLEAMIGLGARP